MYDKIVVKQISIVVFSLLVLSSISFAKKESDTSIGNIELINIAGKQRMLSQRIAKDYLYLVKKIATRKATKQLNSSLQEFFDTHKKLIENIHNPDIKNLLDFVTLSSTDLNSTVHKDFTMDNGQLILDLSESILEGNQYIVDFLNKSIKSKDSDIITTSGEQRMLSERIAKYYVAYQLGLKDKNSVRSMKNTVNKFSDNLNFLIQNSSNSPEINKKLAKINKLWKIVNKFYNNIEVGGLPLIVFNTTDNISKEMDEVTNLLIASKNRAK